MRAVVVVSMEPISRHLAHFLQGLEDPAVQYLGSVGLVESLDIGVLRGLARLNVIEGNALGLVPLPQGWPW
jgi:hypothetical protein